MEVIFTTIEHGNLYPTIHVHVNETSHPNMCFLYECLFPPDTTFPFPSSSGRHETSRKGGILSWTSNPWMFDVELSLKVYI